MILLGRNGWELLCWTHYCELIQLDKHWVTITANNGGVVHQ